VIRAWAVLGRFQRPASRDTRPSLGVGILMDYRVHSGSCVLLYRECTNAAGAQGCAERPAAPG